jgi:hypothetical protein
MGANKYAAAGWLAIVQAVLFPLSFVVGIIEAGIAQGIFDVSRPFFGPSDFMMIVFTIISVYALLMFKQLLNERYEYHDLDLLIYISIWWVIVFQVVGLGLGLLASVYWPVDRILLVVVYLIFMTAAMVSIGIVDILIAVKLLKVKEQFSEYIRAFAYISMAAGILEVTILLSPLSLLLVPVTWIILALIFFRDRQEVQYV